MKISIITITFNSQKTLEETIKSVINQKYENLEYIIIDGGSTDGTIEIVNKYRKYISRFISEKDEGISDAFNKGIRMASGELIGIINSDDMLAENALKLIAKKIYDKTDLIYGNAVLFYDNSEKKNREKPHPNISDLNYTMALIHPATFIKRKAYDEYGLYSTEYKCAMDYEILLRMYKKEAKFQYIDEDLAYFRMGGTNQRYFKRTANEIKQISIKYGYSEIKANMFSIIKKMRFNIVLICRKIGIEDFMRKLFHSKNVEVDV